MFTGWFWTKWARDPSSACILQNIIAFMAQFVALIVMVISTKDGNKRL